MDNGALPFFSLLDRLVAFGSSTLGAMVLPLDSASVFRRFDALLALGFSCESLLRGRFLGLFLAPA